MASAENAGATDRPRGGAVRRKQHRPTGLPQKCGTGVVDSVKTRGAVAFPLQSLATHRFFLSRTRCARSAARPPGPGAPFAAPRHWTFSFQQGLTVCPHPSAWSCDSLRVVLPLPSSRSSRAYARFIDLVGAWTLARQIACRATRLCIQLQMGVQEREES